MGDHAPEMERARVVRIVIAGQAIEPFSLGQTTGAMMRHRGCQHLV